VYHLSIDRISDKILEIVRKESGISSNELVRQMKEEASRVSIFKKLKILEESGLVKVIKGRKGQRSFIHEGETFKMFEHIKEICNEVLEIYRDISRVYGGELMNKEKSKEELTRELERVNALANKVLFPLRFFPSGSLGMVVNHLISEIEKEIFVESITALDAKEEALRIPELVEPSLRKLEELHKEVLKGNS
jgi:Fe2+ or Zn2+ uptake regulation protein